jgi:hypothetical protein
VHPKKKYKTNSVVRETDHMNENVLSDDEINLSQEYLQNVEIVMNEEFLQNDAEFLQNDEEKENTGNFNNPLAVKPTHGF